MAFTSYDSIIAACVAGDSQQRFFSKTASGITQVANGGFSLWGQGTYPSAGSFGGAVAGTWTAQDDTTTGALAFTNPTGPDTLHLMLADCTPTLANAGTLMIYDRLGQIEYLPLQDGSLPEVTAISSDFTARLAAGEGAMIIAEITTSVAAVGAVFQITSYTNQAGTTLRASEAITCTAVASAAVGRFPYTGKWFIGLQSGDTGVRSIEEVTLTASSGTAGAKMNIVACRPLAFIPMITAGVQVERDMVLSLPSLPRIRDDACIAFAALPISTSATVFNGSLTAVAG